MGQLEPKKILLAEDDLKDVELTLLALEQYNLVNEVMVTRNGLEALDYLFRRGKYADRLPGNPVVVLLDLKMPKVGGLEALTQIKADPELKTIPIVILTSSREETDIVKCYKNGANAYVVKPVAFEKFIDVVKQLGLFWVLTNEVTP